MRKLKKVILLGSGGLSIGQAGEFDYSGFQAIRSLEEEGIEVVIINPNIATVQTSPQEGRKVYLYPVEPEWVEKVIQIEKPDGLIAGFGGQTALNCAIQLDQMGVFEKYQVENLGTSIEVLRLTEDRDLFAKEMTRIDVPVPNSFAVTTVEAALIAGEKLKYPVIARAAFALGGLGSGFAENSNELKSLVEKALSTSPQVLIEKSLKGWKEVEYEVMRDSYGNSITLCNMENFDPLGVHTGDSIVVAPSQTLNDDEYQRLRNVSLKIVQHLKIVGECNVQFALNPRSLELYVIEINARLSRSSALASKATGYPIAFIAAKVVLGKSLLEIKNPMTTTTTAFFEPAMDYIAVKIPRWDLGKFKGVSRTIGTTMKSIGEVMAIGRSFPEALQKAIRMVTETEYGLTAPKSVQLNRDFILNQLKEVTDTRLFSVLDGFRAGISSHTIQCLTQIDPWFLNQLFEVIMTEQEISEMGGRFQKKAVSSVYQDGALVSLLKDALPEVTASQWKKWKCFGFSDDQIARLWSREVFSSKEISAAQVTPATALKKEELLQASLVIRSFRKAAGIQPVFKKIDTTAAEFPSESNYIYLSYLGDRNDEIFKDPHSQSAMVLGGGSYRIGSSVEFDWCAVSCIEQLKKKGWSSSVINCNPETVSTDFNLSDRLYFEELTLERILDISEFENPNGIVVSMSGQLPNRLAPDLVKLGLPILGHAWESIDQAENREKFSSLLDQLEILQPRWIEAKSRESIQTFIEEVGFPVLVRPSYVLSGAAMNVAVCDDSLAYFLSLAKDISQDHPVIISQYYENAHEVELDGVAQKGSPLALMVSEHIENAGVHSGDATLVFPAQKLDSSLQNRIKKIGTEISNRLKLTGPFNFQFLIKNDEIRVIECNVRASRSFPFVSKVAGINLIHLATEAMISSENLAPIDDSTDHCSVGVKSAMFSFQRLAGADPVLGVEMASTGEVGCIGQDLSEALVLAFQASGIKPPKKGVFMSAGRPEEKLKLLQSVKILTESKIPIYATTGTALYLKAEGYSVHEIGWNEIELALGQLIQGGKVDFVINVPKNFTRSELSNGYKIRMRSIQLGCSLMTNAEKTNAYLEALQVRKMNDPRVITWKHENPGTTRDSFS